MMPAPPGGPARYVRVVEDLLLAWFGEHGRDLPWRRTRDPYAILLSEVMSQQTQVERVLPRFRRRGFSDAEIAAILVDNPRRLLAFAPPAG